ncbi:hypothetical protein Tco_0467997 [Tanacetum coccineum]
MKPKSGGTKEQGETISSPILHGIAWSWLSTLSRRLTALERSILTLVWTILVREYIARLPHLTALILDLLLLVLAMILNPQPP